MDILAIFVTILGLAAWMGSSIFLTFFVAPMIQRKLNPGKAAELLDSIGPLYYWVGISSAGAMLIGGVGALLYENLRLPAVTFIGLTALAVVISLYGWLVLLPRMVSLRQRMQGSAGTEENFALRESYDQATRISGFLTFLVLLLLLGAAAALAAIVHVNAAVVPAAQ